MKPPMELEGRNLGEKHQYFNKLVNEALASETYSLDEFNIDDNDIENLLKIDVACKKRNVDYIIKVLVCDDMLYVSRAIKQSHWLVTNTEYSHFINSEYLRNNLFPQMNIKSVNKFTNHIQRNLRDTIRAEQFYINEKSPVKAVKWLPLCSPEFILQNFTKHTDHLKISQIKRLCEKTILVLENYIEAYSPISKSKIFEDTVFLLNAKNINKYLDIVEKLQYYESPKFSKSATSVILRLAFERISEKFELYCDFINIPIFIKFLKAKNIRSFLLKQAFKAEAREKPFAIFNRNIIRYFFESMPNEERFDFIRQIFIDKIHNQRTNLSSVSEMKAMSYIYKCVKNKRWFNELQLYQYASFDIAFAIINKLIDQDPQSSDIKVMFSTVIKTAKQNQQNIKILLQYFWNNQPEPQYQLRQHFINDIICQTNFSKFNQSVFKILEDIMMLDIIDSDNEVQQYVETIIIYKVLHFDDIPDIVQNKFQFNSLNTYINRLEKEEKILIFNYLYNQVKSKISCDNLETEENFNETVTILDGALNLLNDWGKSLNDYPSLMCKIRELIHVQKLNSWHSDLSFIYNKNKSWRKWLFEESFELCASQSVFINAIKHDPTIFNRYKSETEEVCLIENVIQFLRKLKLYWPQTLTKVWAEFFRDKLSDLNSQIASSRGICILFPKTELLTILRKYAPENAKVDFSNVNEVNLNLQRCFAKNMHVARPQPPPEVMLLYAKGDYLSYALPSLLSIYHNLSEAMSEKYILELLNSPVSLQKHAIRFAFAKMNVHELPRLFGKVWQTTTNTTIRSILFKAVFNILCKEKDPLTIDTLWNLMEIFIDNLTFDDNKNIYNILLQVSDVPKAVVANFFVKSFKFLKKLCESNNEYKHYDIEVKHTLLPYAREIINILPPVFVINILLDMIKDDVITENINTYALQRNMKVITAYLLSAKDEHTQMQKYEEVLKPIVNSCCAFVQENKCYCIINFDMLLNILCQDIRYTFENKFIFPIKMFSTITGELPKLFTVSENYFTLTKWTLAVLFTKSLNKQNGTFNNWDDLCLAAAPHFGKECYEMLYEHCKTYFPRIYILFANALESVLNACETKNVSQIKIYECLLQDINFVQGYLTVLQLYDRSHFVAEIENEAKNLKEKLLHHPSLEVKMHYYSKFVV